MSNWLGVEAEWQPRADGDTRLYGDVEGVSMLVYLDGNGSWRCKVGNFTGIFDALDDAMEMAENEARCVHVRRAVQRAGNARPLWEFIDELREADRKKWQAAASPTGGEG